MRTLFTLLLLLFVSFGTITAADKPDFRFPKTVAKTAESDLKSALKAGDGEGVVDALVRYSLAWSSISEENLDDITTRIEDLVQKEQRPDIRALLLHLEARVIAAHPNRWQHLEHALRLDTLFEASLRDLPALAQCPLGRYSRIIDLGEEPDSKEAREGQRLLPTLAEFLLFHTRKMGYLKYNAERRKLLEPLIQKERADSLEHVRVYRERQTVSISRPSILGSQDSLQVKVEYRNVDRVTLEVLVLDPQYDYNRSYQIPRKHLTTHLSQEFALPLVKADSDLEQQLTLPPLPYGLYILNYSYVNRQGQRQELENFSSYQLIRVTDVQEVVVNLTPREARGLDDLKSKLLHLNRQSGQPIDHPDPADRFYQHQFPLMGSGLFTDTIFTIKPLTDRGLYRPGETVNYTAVLQGNTTLQNHLLEHRMIVAHLCDTNNQTLVSDTLVTDRFGQVKGSFQLPVGLRTGLFTIWFTACNFHQRKQILAHAFHYFSVSEYKAPTFDIDFAETASVVSATDSMLHIQGRVATFSGLPVSGRQVDLSLSLQSWWRYSDGGTSLTQHQLTTDADGRFTLQVNVRQLMGSSHHWWRTHLNIEASCTNAGGETQQSQHYVVVEGEEPVQPLADTQTSRPEPKLPSQLTADMIPADQVLWIHRMFHQARADRKALIRIGTSLPDAHIYYIVSDAMGVLSHGWLHYAKPGLHDFTYDMPASAPLGQSPQPRDLRFEFLAVRQGEVFTQTCFVSPADDFDQAHISCVTFRDRLLPGTRETWTFRVEGARLNQSQQAARLMLSLYDHSLDAIQPFHWSYNNRKPHRPTSSFVYGHEWRGLRRAGDLSYVESLDLLCPQWPQLQLYGQYFFDVTTRMSQTKFRTQNLVLSDGEVNYASAPLMEVQKAAPMAADAIVESDGDSGIVEEERPVPSAQAAQQLANLKVREGQQRLALWQPMLTTDSTGHVSLTFDVPDQNTTWRLQALALTPWGSYAQLDTTLLAQRPLMVQPSLPRFVRQGDSLSVAGLVLNATPQPQQVTAMVELFDPRTQHTVAQHACTLTLDAQGQQQVMVNVLVPDTLQELAYRIRALVQGGEYQGSGDGEQRLLPVLPAVSPVVETMPFYLNPGDSAFVIDLPNHLPAGADIQLEWCDNPVVYCLEALPALMCENGRTSSALAHKLFAYALSEQVVHRYPQSLADSLLTQLRRLQNGDGGFSWLDYHGRFSSLSATAEVLQLLGELHQLDAYALPEPLTTRALHYYDQEMSRYYRSLTAKQRKHLSCEYFAHYLYLRSLFPAHPLQADGYRLYKEALRQSQERWGELTLVSRAYVALALSRPSRRTTYRQAARQLRVAQQIVESLRQFSLTRPDRGMYWDQLEYSGYRWMANVSQTSLLLQAFAAIDPRTDELDQIRKWLLLEKQTNNWGASSLAADAVYALLSSGSEWQSRSLIGQLSYDSVHDRLLMRDTLATLRQLPSGIRRVEVPAAAADHPSWGAIYMRYAAPTRTALAAANDEISIRKELLDADGHVLSANSKLHVGDLVTIRLIVSTTRDMSEVLIIDERATCLEPQDLLSGYRWGREVGYYLEPLDQRTLLFVPRLPRGEHHITYQLHVTSPGHFALGLASVQCQYAPMFNAHTEGCVIEVE